MDFNVSLTDTDLNKLINNTNSAIHSRVEFFPNYAFMSHNVEVLTIYELWLMQYLLDRADPNPIIGDMRWIWDSKIRTIVGNKNLPLETLFPSLSILLGKTQGPLTYIYIGPELDLDSAYPWITKRCNPEEFLTIQDYLTDQEKAIITTLDSQFTLDCHNYNLTSITPIGTSSGTTSSGVTPPENKYVDVVYFASTIEGIINGISSNNALIEKLQGIIPKSTGEMIEIQAKITNIIEAILALIQKGDAIVVETPPGPRTQAVYDNMTAGWRDYIQERNNLDQQLQQTGQVGAFEQATKSILPWSNTINPQENILVLVMVICGAYLVYVLMGHKPASAPELIEKQPNLTKMAANPNVDFRIVQDALQRGRERPL